MKLFQDNMQEILKFYKEIGQFKKESSRIERHLKLELIINQEYLLPNIDRIKNKNIFSKNLHWKVIEKTKGKSIITGSVALKAFGFLSRPSNNLDLIMLEEQDIKGDVIDMQYSIDNFDKNLIKTIKQKNLIIHLFKTNSEVTIEHEGFIFQNPYQILLAKMKIFKNDGPIKHFVDLNECINKKNTYQNL